MFEGEVTTAYVDNAGTVNDDINDWAVEPFSGFNSNNLFDVFEGIRVTVNGVSKIYTVTKHPRTNGKCVGNPYLYGDIGQNIEYKVEDNGDDIYVQSINTALVKIMLFGTRNPGTYQIKIERALFEPVAYLHNGVRLPGLPEKAKDYSNVFIREDVNENEPIRYYLTATNTPCASDGNVIAIPAPRLAANLIDGVWNVEEYDNSGTAIMKDFMDNEIFTMLWANYDILDTDGKTVIYGKSPDPVPVYE